METLTKSYLGQNVAIKKMSYSGRVNEKFGEIMKEVKLLQRIRNDYVVELIGTFLKEKEYSAWIIMEYCLGSVSDCVEVRVINSKSIFFTHRLFIRTLVQF